MDAVELGHDDAGAEWPTVARLSSLGPARRAVWRGVSALRPVEPPVPGRDARRMLRRPALFGLAASTAVVVGAVLSGPAFVSHAPGAWFFGTPGGPLGSLTSASRRAPVLDLLLVYGGLMVLGAVWVSTCRHLARHPGTGVGAVLVLVAIWSLPFLVGPPLFSRDIYSYAGQGEMVSHHIDPYLYGTGVLGFTPFSVLPGKFWAHTPSPYGPVFLWLDGLAASASWHHALPDVVLLRVLAVVGVLLAVAGIPTLARASGRDPAHAVVLGAGCPLVLTTLVAGGHNDALMVGLLVAGLAVARRFGPVPGIVLCALATGVKAPALLGVVFIGWNWPGREVRAPQRVAATAGALGLAGATLATVSAVTGVGWGWLRTLNAPAKVFTGVTPVEAISKLLTDVGHVLHVPLSLADVRTVAGLVGLLAAAVVGVWLLLRSPEWGAVRCLGVSLLALAVLSPILWAWYLTWGVVVLAAVAGRSMRRVVLVAGMVGTLIGAGSLRRLAETAVHDGLVAGIGLVVGLGVLAVLAWRMAQPVAGAGPPGSVSARDDGTPSGPGGGDRRWPGRTGPASTGPSGVRGSTATSRPVTSNVSPSTIHLL